MRGGNTFFRGGGIDCFPISNLFNQRWGQIDIDKNAHKKCKNKPKVIII